jgi:hypothetical protein
MPKPMRKKPRVYYTGAVPPEGGGGEQAATIVASVSSETLVSTHAGVLWYANLSSLTAMSSEWSVNHNDYNMLGNNPSTWPKISFSSEPQFFGIPSVRFESCIEGMTESQIGVGLYDSTGLGGTCVISPFYRYFDECIRSSVTLTGSSLWNGSTQGVKNNLYMRYGYMIEESVWDGINETGMKLPGLQCSRAQFEGEQPPIPRLWMHHTVPGVDSTPPPPFDPPPQGFYNPPYATSLPIYLQTYWFGGSLHRDLGVGAGWIYPEWSSSSETWSTASVTTLHSTQFMAPNTWHSIEQRWKMNSATSSGVGNFDGELDVWHDDTLVLSMRDTRFRNLFDVTSGTRWDPPSAVDGFYLIIFHGGVGNYPADHIHYRIAGVALATTRIGGMKVV